jgi:hypothetical protein
MTARQRHPKRSSDQSCRMWPALRGADRSAYGPMSVDVPLWHVRARARADPNFLTLPVTPARAVADLPPGVRGGRPPSCDGWKHVGKSPGREAHFDDSRHCHGYEGCSGRSGASRYVGRGLAQSPASCAPCVPHTAASRSGSASLGANLLIILLKSGADARD